MTGVEGKVVVIDRPVESVWSFMIDISNMPLWEDSRAEWKQTSVGPIESGSTFQSSIRVLGREYKVDLRVVEFEPLRKFAVEAMNGFGKGTRLSYLMEPVEGNKTRLSRVTEIQLHGLAKLLSPFQAPIVRRTAGMEANNVKRVVESRE
jgi:carbon monoxide dehydrogenase subunit G